MTQYEYNEVRWNPNAREAATDRLNELGRQGWRVIDSWTLGTSLDRTFLLERSSEHRKEWEREQRYLRNIAEGRI